MNHTKYRPTYIRASLSCWQYLNIVKTRYRHQHSSPLPLLIPPLPCYVLSVAWIITSITPARHPIPHQVDSLINCGPGCQSINSLRLFTYPTAAAVLKFGWKSPGSGASTLRGSAKPDGDSLRKGRPCDGISIDPRPLRQGVRRSDDWYEALVTLLLLALQLFIRLLVEMSRHTTKWTHHDSW